MKRRRIPALILTTSACWTLMLAFPPNGEPGTYGRVLDVSYRFFTESAPATDYQRLFIQFAISALFCYGAFSFLDAKDVSKNSRNDAKEDQESVASVRELLRCNRELESVCKSERYRSFQHLVRNALGSITDREKTGMFLPKIGQLTDSRLDLATLNRRRIPRWFFLCLPMVLAAIYSLVGYKYIANYGSSESNPHTKYSETMSHGAGSLRAFAPIKLAAHLQGQPKSRRLKSRRTRSTLRQNLEVERGFENPE